MNNIAIVIPTRGLVFTEVLLHVEAARLAHPEINFRIFYSFDQTIPDSFNNLTQLALKWKADYVWFIEEDTVPDYKIIDARDEADIVFVDYGVNGWSCSAKKRNGEILWCGFGCTMVKRSVFDKLVYPWFRSDKKLSLNTMQWTENIDKDAYGGHDIWFFTQAREAGCTFKQVEGECKHLKIESLGAPERNYGLHVIKQKPAIDKHQVIN